jgi:hypothetical protein
MTQRFLLALPHRSRAVWAIGAFLILFSGIAAAADDPVVANPSMFEFPTPATSVGTDNGEADFEARANLAILTNACGREPDFAGKLQILANDDLDDEDRYGGQGEGLGPFLQAKVRWLVLHPPSMSCQFTASYEASKTVITSNLEQTQDAKVKVKSAATDRYIEKCKALKWAEIGGSSAVADRVCGTNSDTVSAFQGTAQLAGCVSWTYALEETSTVIPPPDPNGQSQTRFIAKSTISYTIPWACLKGQVNGTVQQFKKVGHMGTSIEDAKHVAQVIGNLFCAGSSKGEYDAELKEHVRLLYLAGAAGPTADYSILDKATVDHMFDELLSARGEKADDKFNVLLDCDDPANEDTGEIEDIADIDEHADNILGVLAGAADDAVDTAGDALGFLPKLFKYVAEVLQKVVVIAVAGSVVGVLLLGSIFQGGQYVAALLFAADPMGALGLGAPFDVKLEETENHRLMIESSRYLINSDIIWRLQDLKADNVDEFQDDNKEVREWLLKRLQSIAKNDFDEYNSRAYTRYSLRAIRNLYDFSYDREIKAAAKIVLDLAESKFAAGSNLGRRMAPYRRKTDADFGTEGDYSVELYKWVQDSDDQVVNATLLSGQTQLLPLIPLENSDRLVPGATSTYRLPRPALEVIVERKLPFSQIANHQGREAYYSSPTFLTTIGGIRTDPKIDLTVLGITDPTDSGISLPTSIMPTGAAPTIEDGQNSRSTFHFRGIGIKDDRTNNLCGWKGFICGVAPHFATHKPVPDPSCDGTPNPNVAFTSPGPDTLTYYYNSAGCDDRPGPPYFMVGRFWRCDGRICDNGQRYGFMEVVPAPALPASLSNDQRKVALTQAFERFEAERTRPLFAVTPDGDGTATYMTAGGDEIQFSMKQAEPKILKVNGEDLTGLLGSSSTGYAGGLINAHDGVGTIASAWGSDVVEFDFSHWASPRSVTRPRRYDETVSFYARTADASELQFTKYLGLPSPVGLGIAGPATLSPPHLFPTLIPTIGLPVFYTMDGQGDFYWLRHDGTADGSDKWSTSPARIGNGWDTFDQIIAGENGVIYGRYRSDQPDSGTLRWYKHLGHSDGSVSWLGGINVGDKAEWRRFTKLFTSSGGAIYGIMPNGDLIWHRHLGAEEGSSNWSEPRQVGTGWQDFQAIMSPGCGVIFGLNKNGELLRYRHLGYLTGEAAWEGPVVVNSGLKNVSDMYALMPNPGNETCNAR